MNRFIHALLYMGLIVVSIISVRSVHGRVEIPRFHSSFKNLITKHDLAVVHFVNYDVLSQQEEPEEPAKKKVRLDDKKPTAREIMPKKYMDDMDDRQMQEPSEADYMLDALEDMKEAFRAAAKSTRFKRANMVFIGVDVTQIPRLIEEYGLYEVSTLMLFKDGIPFESFKQASKVMGFTENKISTCLNSKNPLYRHWKRTKKWDITYEELEHYHVNPIMRYRLP